MAVGVQRTAWSAVEVLRSFGGRGGEDFMYTLLIISYQPINSCRCADRRLYQQDGKGRWDGGGGQTLVGYRIV